MISVLIPQHWLASAAGPEAAQSVAPLHCCRPGYDFESEEAVFEATGYGTAVDSCEEDADGKLWVGNSEYGTRVNYCPFCGYEAREKVDWEPG